MAGPIETRTLSHDEARAVIHWASPVYSITKPAKREGQRGRGSVPSLDRFAWLNLFVDQTMRQLTPAEVAVWLALFRHHQTKTGFARVSQARLAEQTGLSVRSVQLALAGLRRKRLAWNRRRPRSGCMAEYYLWPIAWPGG